MNRPLAPVVVCSVLEDSPERTRLRVEAAPRGCALVEVRADRLRADEVEWVVRSVGRPIAVAARTPRDGGSFDGSEEERRALLVSALRAGAAFVDLEWEGVWTHVASGPDSHRVILSHHGAACDPSILVPLYRAMAATAADRMKIVPSIASPDQTGAVRDLLALAGSEGKPLACFALGSAGRASRILAPSWGSWATYGAAERGRETAAGQLPAADLLDLYDVLRIGGKTRRFALVGRAVGWSPSPAMHSAAYRALGIDACYLPVDAASFDEIPPLTGDDGILGLGGLAVTAPFKEDAARWSEAADPCARAAGSVNTVTIDGRRRLGFNTDGPAALALLKRSGLDPSGVDVAIVGAGGTARSIGAALVEAGAHLRWFNRSRKRAERAAAEIGGVAASLQALAGASFDLLVQATPRTWTGDDVGAALGSPRSGVLDVVYGAEPTPIVREARRRGWVAIDGFDLLVEQAALQFQRLTGSPVERNLLDEAGRAWLAAHGDAEERPQQAEPPLDGRGDAT